MYQKKMTSKTLRILKNKRRCFRPISREIGRVVGRLSRLGGRNREVVLKGAWNLAGGHGLGDETLKSQLLLLQVIGGGVVDLELAHGVTQSRLNLLLVATLELEGHGGVGDDLLNTGNVRFELLTGLELLAEFLVAGLEFGGIWKTIRKNFTVTD